MTKVQSTLNLVLKVIAIGMVVPGIILGALDMAPLETSDWSSIRPSSSRPC